MSSFARLLSVHHCLVKVVGFTFGQIWLSLDLAMLTIRSTLFKLINYSLASQLLLLQLLLVLFKMLVQIVLHIWLSEEGTCVLENFGLLGISVSSEYLQI